MSRWSPGNLSYDSVLVRRLRLRSSQLSCTQYLIIVVGLVCAADSLDAPPRARPWSLLAALGGLCIHRIILGPQGKDHGWRVAALNYGDQHGDRHCEHKPQCVNCLRKAGTTRLLDIDGGGAAKDACDDDYFRESDCKEYDDVGDSNDGRTNRTKEGLVEHVPTDEVVKNVVLHSDQHESNLEAYERQGVKAHIYGRRHHEDYADLGYQEHGHRCEHTCHDKVPFRSDALERCLVAPDERNNEMSL
mmetsp:Transcript_23277/g.63079  ORF Transcript_23277/g.63079 Transcript_23277/m.63079 type:complete len:246 (+) Transcript_23277:172-909(+)